MTEIHNFYVDQAEPNKSCFLALRDIIMNCSGELVETIKYGMPCFIFRKKALCYLWKDKKTDQPYILMVDGNLINHPALETGDRKRMSIIRIRPTHNIPVETVQELISMAIKIRT